jgi:hypothetical protein
MADDKDWMRWAPLLTGLVGLAAGVFVGLALVVIVTHAR